MSAKTESSIVPEIVRWTEDEWIQISSHLYSNKGTVQLTLSNVGEVKAKDVFVAQQVLLAGRHRKLVSIAQGFDVIRTRLGTIFQSLPQARQDDFFPPQYLAHRDGKDEKRKASHTHEPATGRAGRLQGKGHRNKPEVIFHSEPQAESAGSATVTVNPAQSLHTARLTREVGEPTVESSLRDIETLEAQASSLRQKGLPSSDQPTPFPGTTTLVELARPFIEMICEEFIRAFVRVLSSQEVQDALQTSTFNTPGRRAASTQDAFNGRYSEVAQPSPEPDNSTQTQGSIADDQSRPAFLSEASADEADSDEVDSDEVEVQPLFDPKLPPSANSDFKPNIGVVAAHANDLQELRLLYPQLNLTIVQADSISDVRCFGHCQRIIALRDEVSPATDEQLGRLLQHRYVRLGGGLSGIKAQLNAWLHAPGSISSPPKRSVPPYGREAVGEMVKKRQNRYPRMIGR